MEQMDNTVDNVDADQNLSFAEMFKNSISNSEIRSGDVITAEVIDINDNFVIVNAGLKSESYIPIEEFKNEAGELEVKVGDYVSVAIENIENGYGDTILSRDRAKKLAAWLSLEDALESGEIVTGLITNKIKGGLNVIVRGLKAFLPGSLIDTKPVKDVSIYENQSMEFKVIKLDRKKNNIVISRKAIIEDERSIEINKRLEFLQNGTIVTGVVKSVSNFGAFVDLNGVDGLLHITDMSWSRVADPREITVVGQEITAMVLRYDEEKKRLSLGLKQMTPDPWPGVEKRYAKRTKVKGKVINLEDFGAFVEIEPGVRGLVHVSEMDWTNKNISPKKVVQPGDEVEVMILDIDEAKRRVSLGIKQCLKNPWEEFEEKYKKGDKVKGPIKSITDFGIFIGLDNCIDGMVHYSDLSWTERGENLIKEYKKGQEVEAVILGIDIIRERVSLGIKQLNNDAFFVFVSEHEKDLVVPGTVKMVNPDGILVELAPEVMGFVKSTEIANEEEQESSANKFKEGDLVNVKILFIDRKNRNINLSIKAASGLSLSTLNSGKSVDKNMQAKAEAETVNSAKDENDSEFGALLRKKLNENKEE